MGPSLPTHLDPAMFEQAWAVLERAQPTPREDLLFRILNFMVWGAVGLTSLFLLLRWRGVPPGGATVWIARTIALVYVLIIPVLLLNWKLVTKLLRAARSRRMLEPSFRRRLAGHFKARRRSHRLANLATLTLSMLGYVVAGAGLLGMISEMLPDGNAPRLRVFTVATVFGLSCVFQHFIARGRERLAVIAELRSSLLAGRTEANESRLTGEQYDEITRIERGQIAADRRRSIKSAAGESLEQTYSSKEHRSVRDAKLALAPETLVKVQACLDRLTARPPLDDETHTRAGISYVKVPDTSLEMGFTVDSNAREIKVLWLSATNQNGTWSSDDASEQQ